MTSSRSDIALSFVPIRFSFDSVKFVHRIRLLIFSSFFVGACSWLSGCCGVHSGCGGSSCSPYQSQIATRISNGLVGGCTSGCGEVYWDEHINVPPTCDPCGCNGEFVGGSCGACRPLLHRIRDLMGARYIAECDSCNSCSSCDHGGGYATQYSGNSGGYCPSCHDGTAGNPESYSTHSVQPNHQHGSAHNSYDSRSQNANSLMRSEPTPANRPSINPAGPSTSGPSSSGTKDTSPMRLQPVPDSAADAIPLSEPPTVPSARRTSRSATKIGSNYNTNTPRINSASNNSANNRRPQPRLVAR